MFENKFYWLRTLLQVKRLNLVLKLRLLSPFQFFNNVFSLKSSGCNEDKQCPSCMNCIERNCLRIECSGNSECGPMYVCRDGQCAPEKCFKDYECGRSIKGWSLRCFEGSCFHKPPTTFDNPSRLCKIDKDCELHQNFDGECFKVDIHLSIAFQLS